MAPLIVHVINRLDYGGLENGVVNLLNRLPPQRYRHAVVCVSGVNPDFRRRILRDDIEVLSLDKRPGKDFRAYARMWRVLRRLRPAIVHTRNIGTIDMQWMAACARVPGRVHGEHGWAASDPRGQSRKGRWMRRLCRPVIDLYVPVSRDLAQWLEHDIGVPRWRIRQSYNGVDAQRFQPRLRDGAEPVVVVGTVGRLDPIKNHAALLDAVRDLKTRRPDLAGRAVVRIVGDGPSRGELLAKCTAAGLDDMVEFVGARDDIPQQMDRMHVFVLPSINEGISNTILEAMASGLPVVAGRVGGNGELVEDGSSGILYDARRPGELSEALLRYVDDPDLRARHGGAARARAVREFSMDAMVRRYVEIYDELLSPRERTAASSRSAGGD